MPRGETREPGLKKLPGVPYREGQAWANHRDCDESRGPLAYVPRGGVHHVMDFGAPTEATTLGPSTGSPASGRFTPGRPSLAPSQAQQRETQETQAPMSRKSPA